jgi:hypothetical protein
MMTAAIPDLNDLYHRVVEANSATEQAIASYNARKAQIVKEMRGDATRIYVANRDDVELREIASRVAFRSSNALRLASTLQIELLGVLVKRSGAPSGEQKP